MPPAPGLTLVTGATGLVGHHIAAELLRRGRAVRCLVRDLERARAVVPDGAELARGDVTDQDSVRAAMAGCAVVYHAAGLPEQWLRDVSTFDRVNRGGTEVVGEAALAAGVDRFVFTSTIDVFRGGPGERYDESMLDPDPKGTHYERSKQAADRWVAAAVERGLPAVFLHPAAVYGPGPAASPGTNQFLLDLSRGKVPALLPGGMPLVFAPDVGLGHVLAERSPVGARYILADRYYTMQDIAALVRHACGSKIPRTLPRWLARVVSAIGEMLARLTRRPPLLPRGQLHFLLWGAQPSSDHAQKDLGWHPTPLAQGLAALLAAARAPDQMA
ncbi:MAG TPA: NAD-dependent epimerase/dehydratase family protein [Kofleriaceae bacterium]|nr:NAD-dependent epimerase/dehydratase family protein [Kofleriaceae bacterium]